MDGFVIEIEQLERKLIDVPPYGVGRFASPRIKDYGRGTAVICESGLGKHLVFLRHWYSLRDYWYYQRHQPGQHTESREIARFKYYRDAEKFAASIINGRDILSSWHDLPRRGFKPKRDFVIETLGSRTLYGPNASC